MKITVVNISDENLFDGAKVRHKNSGQIRTVKVLPKDKTLAECAREGLFDVNNDIDFNTLMLNKTRFELVQEE